ncbi:GNAT family N-acetyltransferase [Nocardioides sp. GY 10127]|uniref:GNAT family N-acetyltransferase n=1 Tax=Nocardioides sp. GY 10127 TaxID=2569762 RepID=UPI0010A81347|nr:GNAT family N-acetyltransferase [Nocardioides sp. GY 10127]TIC79925.1 GNAT family N-acetyltransferase [Nocardioides sp. GY 10127]
MSSSPAQVPVATWDDGFRLVQVGFGHPDAVRLVAEVQAVYVERYGEEDVTPLEPEMFDPPSGSFFVGYLGDDPVASGAWRRHPEVAEQVGWPGLDVAEIKRMYVAPRAQRRGLARRVLGFLEGHAREAGIEALVLESGIHQPEALALYDTSGYADIPGYGVYVGDPEAVYRGKRLDVVAG